MNTKLIFYLLMMIAGSALFFWFREGSIQVGGIFGFILFAAIIALIVKGVKSLWARFIKKNGKSEDESKSFLFEFTEDTFAWWIIIFILNTVSQFFT